MRPPPRRFGMERNRGILRETLRYLWRRLVTGRTDADALSGDHLVDQPHDSAQRRSFVRGGCVYPFEFAPVSGDGPRGQGAMLNVSGSGMLFVTRHAIPAGSALACAGKFFGRPMRLQARVVRVDSALEGFESLHAYGAVFTSIAEGDRRLIIRAVFGESRHLCDLGDRTEGEIL